MNSTVIFALSAVSLVLVIIIAITIKLNIALHTLGTFKFDNSGDTYRCLMEFDNLDEVEKLKYAIVKIEEADLSLPGESRAQD